MKFNIFFVLLTYIGLLSFACLRSKQTIRRDEGISPPQSDQNINLRVDKEMLYQNKDSNEIGDFQNNFKEEEVTVEPIHKVHHYIEDNQFNEFFEKFISISFIISALIIAYVLYDFNKDSIKNTNEEKEKVNEPIIEN